VPQVRNTSGWGQNETRHFIDCLKTGKEPLARAEEAVTMMRIIDAIYASSDSGHEIDLAASGA
jgi:predicted dehydrogenase